MSIIRVDKDELFPTIRKKLKQVDIVLDLGCGIRPQNLIRPVVHICCEPFKQYLEYLRESFKNESYVYYIFINASWTEALKLFPSKSVDTVFLVDVVEHLDKEEGIKLLNATEDIVKQQIAVFTPLGFLPQSHPDGKDAWGLDGGLWQKHKSGWWPEDFDASWSIYAAEAIHTTDNLGRQFEKPYGAFWAIKTFPQVKINKPIVLSKRLKIHKIVDKAIDVVNNMRGAF